RICGIVTRPKPIPQKESEPTEEANLLLGISADDVAVIVNVASAEHWRRPGPYVGHDFHVHHAWVLRPTFDERKSLRALSVDLPFPLGRCAKILLHQIIESRHGFILCELICKVAPAPGAR